MVKCIKSLCLGSRSVSDYYYYYYYYYYSMALQSNEYFRLPNEPLPVSSVRWPLPPTCNFAFVSIRLFTILLILFHYLGQFHSVWLFRPHNLGFKVFFSFLSFFLSFFFPWPVVGLSPNPQLILVAFYAMHGLQWRYSPITIRRKWQLNKRKLMWSL